MRRPIIAVSLGLAALFHPALAATSGERARFTSRSEASIPLDLVGAYVLVQVRVNGSESSGLARCVSGVMKSAKFPSFKGTRTRASFSMSI